MTPMNFHDRAPLSRQSRRNMLQAGSLGRPHDIYRADPIAF
jgi:hypothetical protein